MSARMNKIFIMVILSLLTVGNFVFGGNKSDSAKEITFTAADGFKIYGDLYKSSKGKEAPMLIIFHQARSNARGEYHSIIPILIAKDYNILAIDQRSGGNQFGSSNRTVDNQEGKNYTYCEAYPDLEAALKFAEDSGFTGKRIVWGSSYSAGLVIKLGAEHPDEIDGVLAFSPASGPAMEKCSPNPYITKLKVPALALRPASEMEYESVRDQLEMFKNNGKGTYVAENGVHGSSMLDPERTENNVDDTWAVVIKFIEKVFSE